MCLILLAWRKHPDYSLVVAANRDEFHARPASAAAYWKDRPGILAGRDLQAQGTWLGVSRSGRFASVTNYRGAHDPNAARSRGALVADFLSGNLAPGDFIAGISPASYSGFNLLAADGDELWWLSNHGNGARKLEPGYYALGNLLLDSPEVHEIRTRFEATPIAMEPLFALLSTAKILAPVYGTRCSSVLLVGAEGRVQFAER
ncbi:MAG: NRDE family protein, partial [Burkholderiales bacterium]